MAVAESAKLRMNLIPKEAVQHPLDLVTERSLSSPTRKHLSKAKQAELDVLSFAEYDQFKQVLHDCEMYPICIFLHKKCSFY